MNKNMKQDDRPWNNQMEKVFRTAMPDGFLESEEKAPEAWELPACGNLSFGVTVGTHCESGNEVFQFNEDRYRHTIILGRTGAGKSNHIQQMEREDIRSGAGVFILAAHEDDALYPLSCVPEERLGDVVFIDASNPEYLPRMNPLDVDMSDSTAADKAMNDIRELLLMDCHRIWAGVRFDQYLFNGIGLLMSDPRPYSRSITELNGVFTEPDEVKKLLKFCTDKNVYDFWTKVFPQVQKSNEAGDITAWFLSKVNRFSADRTLKHVFGAGRSTIDIQNVVDEGKILIAYVPESRIGTIAARSISKWLIIQLRDAIMNRRPKAGGWQGLDYGMYEGGSRPGRGASFDSFFVYVDEFAKFAGQDFEVLLAEARKKCVGFVLATQTLSQTRTYDIKTDQVGQLEEAILGNVGSMICYPMGTKDAEMLSRQFDVDAEKLRRIERYHPLARLCVDNQVVRPGTLEVGLRPDPDNPTAARRVAKSHVLSGAWVEVEGALNKGAFMKAVSGPASARRPGGGGVAGRPQGKFVSSAEAWPDASSPLPRQLDELLGTLFHEYEQCLPATWHLILEDAMREGLADALGHHYPLSGEPLEDYAAQHMRAHAVLSVADFLEDSLPACDSVDDFCYYTREIARLGTERAEAVGSWASFEGIAYSFPKGMVDAWHLANDPALLRAYEEDLMLLAGASPAALFNAGCSDE